MAEAINRTFGLESAREASLRKGPGVSSVLYAILVAVAAAGSAAGAAQAESWDDRLRAIDLGAAPAWAGWQGATLQMAQADEAQPFAIAAQPLTAALDAFSDQTGLSFAYTTSQLEGVASNGVTGTFTPREALAQLLTGTGVTFRFTGSETVSLNRTVVEESGEEGLRRLGPVTVTATRVERPISAIPGSVTVIDADEVEVQRQISPSIQRMIRRAAPGFQGGTGNQTGGNTLRGRSALVLQDGVPQQPQLRGSGRAWSSTDPRHIERIEVVRTANAAFGFGGAGGSINIITRRPTSEEPLITFEVGTAFQPHEAELDAFSREAYAAIEGREGEFDYLFSGSFRDTGKAFDAEGDRVPDDETEFGSDIYSFQGILGWRPKSERSVELKLNYFREQQQDSGRTMGANAIVGERKADAVPEELPFQDPWQSFNALLTYNEQDVFGSDLTVSGFFQRSDNDRSQDFQTGVGTQVRGKDTRIDQRVGTRLNIETPLPFGLALVWGGDFVSNFNSELIDDEVSGRDLGFRPDVTQNNLAGFAQLDIPFGDFLLTGGVRHERFFVDFDDVVYFEGRSFSGGNINYNETLFNVGLVYYVTDAAELFAGFSQGLDVSEPGRASSSGLGLDSVDQIELAPAVTDSYEVGARYLGARWDASLTGFFTDSELSSRTINPGGALALAVPLRQPERVWGVEATLNVDVTEQWRVGGIAAYQDGEREVDGDTRELQSNLIQPFRLAGYLEYDPFPWLSTELNFEYAPGSDRFPGSTAFGEGETTDLFLMDFAATARSDYGDFLLGVENLLNRQYISPGGEATNIPRFYFAQPGRTVRLAYRLQF